MLNKRSRPLFVNHLWVEILGFRVWGVGFGVWGSGFREHGFGVSRCRV